jgi:hypothetical protein
MARKFQDIKPEFGVYQSQFKVMEQSILCQSLTQMEQL